MGQEVKRFSVYTEAGKEYTIVKYKEYVSDECFRNPHAKMSITEYYQTNQGQAVNYNKEEDTYEIVETGEITRKSKRPEA